MASKKDSKLTRDEKVAIEFAKAAKKASKKLGCKIVGIRKV